MVRVFCPNISILYMNFDAGELLEPCSVRDFIVIFPASIISPEKIVEKLIKTAIIINFGKSFFAPYSFNLKAVFLFNAIEV